MLRICLALLLSLLALVACTGGGGGDAAQDGATTIEVQPLSQAAVVGGSVTLSVSASGTALSYQWQRNQGGGAPWTDIAGATAASYTLSGVTSAMNGWQFRVAIGTGSSTVSSPATLTVAASTAPVIVVQPADVQVLAGADASFSATATGTPTPTWQWQLSSDGTGAFTNIAGATSASYTTLATTAADNGKRFRVVASNLAGSSTSSVAVLTVNAAAVSPLAGRSWRTGQLVVAGAPSAQPFLGGSVIDDVGRVTLVYQQNSGGASTLYALRATPNAAAAAPSWSAPVKLGPLAGAGLGGTGLQTVVTPGGDVGVLWNQFVACGPTDYQTTSDCYTAFVSRYRASSDSWDAPVPVQGLVPVTPATLGLRLWIDDQGNMLVSGSGWVRSGTTGYTAKDAIFMRAAGETLFRQQLIEDAKASSRLLAMDNQGRILMGATYSQNATTDAVVYRGNISNGLEPTPLVLDSRASPAQVRKVEVGANGQQIVLWLQNNGVRDTWYSAIAASPADAFSLSDMGIALGATQPGNAKLVHLFVGVAGEVLVYDQLTQQRIRWTAATGWGPALTIPGLGQSSYRVGFNRRGDYLRLDTADVGNTAAYDGARNLQLPSPGYVLGTATQTDISFAYADPVVSLNGMAFQSLRVNFDVLPTPALPAGDGRSAVFNLWGVYLK